VGYTAAPDPIHYRCTIVSSDMDLNKVTTFIATGCTFNHVGRDQYNYNNDSRDLILRGSRQQIRRATRKEEAFVQQSLQSSLDVLSKSKTNFETDLLDFSSIVDLLDNIDVLLDDVQKTSDAYDCLDLELELLRSTLHIVRSGLEAYGSTPLGRGLPDVLNPVVSRCGLVLQELYHTINIFGQGLQSTDCPSLWERMWWTNAEIEDPVMWRVKLSDCRKSLGLFIRALHW
jgi:hypothetical protein